jgi:ribosomal protein L37AE/L43A
MPNQENAPAPELQNPETFVCPNCGHKYVGEKADIDNIVQCGKCGWFKGSVSGADRNWDNLESVKRMLAEREAAKPQSGDAPPPAPPTPPAPRSPFAPAPQSQLPPAGLQTPAAVETGAASDATT